MNSRELAEKCRQGNRNAQQELYAQTSQRIYRLCLRMLGNTDDAFDVAQEVYLKAFARIGDFAGQSSLATWLYRIAVNEALQHLRRQKRYTRTLEQMPPPVADQVAEVSAVAVSIDLQDALAELPEFERTLIVLRHLQGLSYDEIADVLDRSAGTVASGLNRARRMLRDRLEEKSVHP